MIGFLTKTIGRRPQDSYSILPEFPVASSQKDAKRTFCCCTIVHSFSAISAREALLALEKEGTVIISPYKGAIVKPLSPEEVLDIAELRLTLISLAVRSAHRHLAPADFDRAYEVARRITRTNSAKEHFECNRSFWDTIFGKAERPILREVSRQLEDRTSRYVPLLIKLFSTPESRPRQREVLIELYRKGKITEAFRAFKKIYLEVIDQIMDHLKSQEAS
jgi:DNA-binding GntR family transcriptional regulator